MTNENWQEKFQAEVYLELFRFRKCDMFLLAEALEVNSFKLVRISVTFFGKIFFNESPKYTQKTLIHPEM